MHGYTKNKNTSCYKIEISTRPVPKSRPRLGINGKMYTPQETREFERLIGWAAKNVVKQPIETSVQVTIDVYSKTRADLDNIAKAVLDGLNKVAFIDDRQVVDLHIKKLVPCDGEKIVIRIKEKKEE